VTEPAAADAAWLALATGLDGDEVWFGVVVFAELLVVAYGKERGRH
jgi:hypothetical protein